MDPRCPQVDGATGKLIGVITGNCLVSCREEPATHVIDYLMHKCDIENEI